MQVAVRPARIRPPGHSVTTRIDLTLADLYAAQARHEFAEPLLLLLLLLLAAIATQRVQLGGDHPITPRSVGMLIEHVMVRGMDATASEWASGQR